ncbi:unnamed protein product [Thelazia callipaeda]|uniref:Anaphase-promoting complex subunit 4 n=1 Tax=Thelazia callipaeda TaxID=103827 RepID=A0A0N5D5U1_THECL|nr:unnamed protein product [Thelazia callipaeda]
MKAFSDDSIGSLLGTLMFTVDEENVVGVLAAGILPIGSIKPPMQFFVNCDPYSIRVGDIFYSTVKNQLMVVYSSVGQYCAEVNSPGINTQMIGFDLDSFDYLKSGVVWAIARRWLKLVFNMCFISETFARAIIDWEDQSKFFVEKFNSFGTEKTADHGLGECLINMILTGQANPDLVNFYRNVLKPAEWKKMANWVDKGFSDLIGSIGKDLLPGAEALQHNVRQLLTEICCTLQGSKPKNILPKRLFDVDVYPYGKYVEEESDEESLKELKNLHNLAEDVNNKMNEMHLIAVRNRKDLMNFMSWLSQTPPFTAKNKRSATDMKFDVQLVIEYIKQATMSINGNGSSQNKAMSSAQKNYSFDKVLQYFKCQKPLKCRLDVRSNLWNILPEQESTRTLTDCITSCFDALQTVQDVIQKRFTLAIVAVTNDVLELNHEEGFEKFTIFSPSQAALECRTNGEQKWRQTMASEPFAVSCIGVDGNRHIIYGALGVVFYKMHYTKQSMKSTDENAGVKQKSQGTVDSSFRLEFDNTDLCTDERQSEVGENVMGVDIAMPKSPASAKLLRVEECLNSSINRRLMHFEWVGNGNFYGLLGISKGNKEETLLFRTSLVDDTSYVHEDTSGCMETYCSCAISLRQKSGIAFTDNGARAKWFEIKIAEDHVSQVTRKKPKNINYKDEIPTNQRAQAQNTETMEVNTEAESEKDAVPGERFASIYLSFFPSIVSEGQQIINAVEGGCNVNEDCDNTNDVKNLLQRETRRGDVISPHRAILTLSKSMFNAGCFSLPYAWKLGGLWMSFALNFIIAGFNWYGNHILVRSSQHLAKKSERVSLDYGHFAKKVCDFSSIRFLRNNSKVVMYIVNVTILFYQLGMCSVAILFIADNMNHLLGDYIVGGVVAMALISSSTELSSPGTDVVGKFSEYGASYELRKLMLIFLLVPIFVLNMFTEMRVLSVFAMFSSVFFLLGAISIMQFTVRQPNHWNELPSTTNFTGIIMFVGMAMYAFEGQTMILPVENKLETPEDFLNNFGVLPTTMSLCTLFMTAIGFFGYTAFGSSIKPTITMNVPKKGLYSTINVFLILQSMLGHSIAMYVIIDMFFNGFQRKFLNRFPTVPKVFVDKGFRIFWVLVTVLMSIGVPHLEIMIPLVGVTSGTICALIYPPIFEMITFWSDWKVSLTARQRYFKISRNIVVIIIGIFAICSGVYANCLAIFEKLRVAE